MAGEGLPGRQNFIPNRTNVILFLNLFLFLLVVGVFGYWDYNESKLSSPFILKYFSIWGLDELTTRQFPLEDHGVFNYFNYFLCPFFRVLG